MARFLQPFLAALAVSSFSILGLAGCGAITSPSAPDIVPAAGIAGRVIGGQQPITNSTVTVWQVGTTGYGSPATQLAQTTTDSNGSFNIAANTYTCPAPDTQVYITAAGGDATPGFDNPAIMLAAGLGNCAAAAQDPQININEVTTAVFAYALNNYFSYPLPSNDSVGSDATSLPGLTLSMTSTIPMLVNLATGTVNPNTPTLTIEAAKIYSLANTLAACVNSTVFDTTTCSTLFTDTSDTGDPDTPDNTLEAAMQMAYLPYQNVTALYNLGQPTAPFVGLSTAPNDWSLGVAYTTSSMGLGIAQTPQSVTSASMDIDASGNIWFPSTLPGATGVGDFDPSTTTFGGPYLNGAFTQPQYVSIDSNGFIWVTDVATPTVGLTDTTAPAAGPFAASLASDGIASMGPVMAADQSGDVYFAYVDSSGVPNLGGLNASGGGGPFGAFTYFPTSLAALQFGAFAGTSGLSSPCAGEEMDSDSPTFDNYIDAETTGNCASGGGAIASSGSDAIISATSFNEICSGLYGVCFTPPAPVDLPEGIATDGFGQEWIANSGNGSVTLMGGVDDTNAYDEISPIAYLHDATHGNTMTAPYAIAVDGAGNVWVANASCVSTTTTLCTPTAFQLSELIGAAGPAITPLVAQDQGTLAGTAPAFAGHPVALTHHMRTRTSAASGRASHWHSGSSSAPSPASRFHLRSTGVPWLIR